MIWATRDRALGISKRGAESLRKPGLDAFRNLVARVAPEFKDLVDRLRDWCLPGLLCIGDCAHAMSPIGGVGINLAVHDTVAAANILWAALKTARRHMTQRPQMVVQDRVMRHVLNLKRDPKPPPTVKLFNRFAFLRHIPARPRRNAA